jgi:hypothetical protein
MLLLLFAAPDPSPANRKMVRAEAKVRCDCYANIITSAERIQRKIAPYKSKGRRNRKYVTPQVTFKYDFDACLNDKRSSRLRAHRAALSGAGLIAFNNAVNERVSKRCSRTTARFKSIKLN